MVICANFCCHYRALLWTEKELYIEAHGKVNKTSCKVCDDDKMFINLIIPESEF